MVAITASVEGFFHFGDRWRHYRVNAELLKSEGWQYLTGSGGYRKRRRTPSRRSRGSRRAWRRSCGTTWTGFMTQMTQHAPIEKHDIFTKL